MQSSLLTKEEVVEVVNSYKEQIRSLNTYIQVLEEKLRYANKKVDGFKKLCAQLKKERDTLLREKEK